MKKPKNPVYADLGDFEEDQRIGTIGLAAMAHGQTVAFVTDDDPGKADRYIRKLKERFPGISVIERFNGPVAGTVTVKVGPPDPERN